MTLDATCHITHDNPGEVPALFMLRPRSGWAQWITRESYHITPQTQLVEFEDAYGNLCQRLVMPPGEFNVCIEVRAEVPEHVDVDPAAPVLPVTALPPEAWPYLLPSRYCQTDLISQVLPPLPGTDTQDYRSVEAIRAWIHEHITYQYGTSNASTSALETAQSRIGVCRDFAHLGITLCRRLNIPARMVVGFLHELEPMDLHAWFEAYLGGRWFTFDPTQDQPRGGRIVVAYGRDAADVALATTFAPTTLTAMAVTVTRAPL